MISLMYWYLFPISIIIATLAMSTLVGGATFFSPLFILLLKLPPHIAIPAALTTQFFGFTTGMIGYMKKKCIDYRTSFILLIITIPYALIGVYIGTKIDAFFIKILLGIILIYIACSLYSHNKLSIRGKTHVEIHYQRNDKTIKMGAEDVKTNVVSTAIGSLFLGMTSAGLGEMLGFDWINKSKASFKTLVSSTVFIIAITTAITSLAYLIYLSNTDASSLKEVANILIFTIPGVIMGARWGVRLIHHIDQKTMQIYISFILFIAGILCFVPF